MSNAILEAFLVGHAPVLARRNAGNAKLCQSSGTSVRGILFDTALECIQETRAILLDMARRRSIVERAREYALTWHSAEREAEEYATIVRQIVSL